MPVQYVRKTATPASNWNGENAGIGVDSDDNRLYFNPNGTKRVLMSDVNGTSSATLSIGADGGNLQQLYGTSDATAGNDARGLYARVYFESAGGGEAVRAYGTINNATVATGGTVNGAHISLNATGASAAVSGQANALRVTLDMAASVGAIGGNMAVILCESWIATGPTIPAKTAFIHFNNGSTQKLSYLFRMSNADTSNMFVANTDTPDKGLLVDINGTDYWIMVSQATS